MVMGIVQNDDTCAGKLGRRGRVCYETAAEHRGSADYKIRVAND